MCLITLNPEILTAEHDIICFKIGKLKSDGFVSPYQNFKYSKDKLYNTEISEPTEDGKAFDNYDTKKLEELEKTFLKPIFISKGFHSAYTFERLCKITPNLGDLTGLFIIPKGSLYVEGCTELLVSNQIVFKSIVTLNDKDEIIAQLCPEAKYLNESV